MFLKLILFLIVLFQISKCQQNIQVSINNIDQNILVTALDGEIYAELSKNGTSKIKITCTKSNDINLANGTLFALVNTKQAQYINCDNYANSNINDINCVKRNFYYDLASEAQTTTSFNIQCTVTGGLAQASLYLPKLYVDNLPRIRAKYVNLNDYGDTKTYNIDQDTVSCESINDEANLFDSLQWYTIYSFNQNFNLTYNKSELLESVYNYTNVFKLTESNRNLYTPDSTYRCCTALNNIPVNCTNVYLTGSGLNFFTVPSNSSETTTYSSSIQTQSSNLSTQTLTTVQYTSSVENTIPTSTASIQTQTLNTISTLQYTTSVESTIPINTLQTNTTSQVLINTTFFIKNTTKSLETTSYINIDNMTYTTDNMVTLTTTDSNKKTTSIESTNSLQNTTNILDTTSIMITSSATQILSFDLYNITNSTQPNIEDKSTNFAQFSSLTASNSTITGNMLASQGNTGLSTKDIAIIAGCGGGFVLLLFAIFIGLHCYRTKLFKNNEFKNASAKKQKIENRAIPSVIKVPPDSRNSFIGNGTIISELTEKTETVKKRVAPKHDDVIDAFDDTKVKNLIDIELDSSVPAHYIALPPPHQIYNELAETNEIEVNHLIMQVPSMAAMQPPVIPVPPTVSTAKDLGDYLSESTFIHINNEIPDETPLEKQKIVYY